MSIIRLDESLVAVIEENERIIRSYLHHAPSLVDADIAWGEHAQLVGGEWTGDDAKINHAIGMIAGIAAALGTTPQHLLMFYRGVPPCVRDMRCLCAGHARGDAPDVPCNTDETTTPAHAKRTKIPKIR